MEDEVRRGELVTLSIDQVRVEREFRLIRHKNKFVTPQMTAFAEICKTAATQT